MGRIHQCHSVSTCAVRNSVLLATAALQGEPVSKSPTPRASSVLVLAIACSCDLTQTLCPVAVPCRTATPVLSATPNALVSRPPLLWRPATLYRPTPLGSQHPNSTHTSRHVRAYTHQSVFFQIWPLYATRRFCGLQLFSIFQTLPAGIVLESPTNISSISRRALALSIACPARRGDAARPCTTRMSCPSRPISSIPRRW